MTTHSIGVPVSSKLEMKRNGKYALKKYETADVLIAAIIFVFVATLFFFLFFVAEYKWDQFSANKIVEITTQFFRFDLVKPSNMVSLSFLLVNTIFLAFVTTAFGAIVALPFGLLAARNISHPLVSTAIRSIASFVRSVPTIIWVLMLISGYGLTATTAVVGMVFHTWSFFVKSYSEAFEEVGIGTIEALKATGCSWLQVITCAIIPSALTKMISWIAIRSEINFAISVVIGPAVGVPGMIGSMINGFSRVGDYSSLGFAICLVIVVAFLFELLINKIRYATID